MAGVLPDFQTRPFNLCFLGASMLFHSELRNTVTLTSCVTFRYCSSSTCKSTPTRIAIGIVLQQNKLLTIILKKGQI